MGAYTKSMQDLIDHFKKMPGIGSKTAERMAFYVLKSSAKDMENFSSAIRRVKEQVRFCGKCGNLSETDLCSICNDSRRDKGVVCVVEQPNDLILIEKSGHYKGTYHVLFGAIAPLDGIGPDEIRLKELIARVKDDKVKEVIIATNSNAEGETTSLYISKELKSSKIKITRIAYGIPVGGGLEYIDQATLVRALEGRRSL
ncbi:MAG: recombination mediator RecR [Candidatus Omnitrophica bacterium]|nr:recombination mediator RecR [Candidatus Omnitrophota bacterium]MBU4148905.1 recombination mediator RecR [Candidatus Omnitrophota bacterium]